MQGIRVRVRVPVSERWDTERGGGYEKGELGVEMIPSSARSDYSVYVIQNTACT